jgi:[acyl-carrier-protein] S-malonyltransferase
VAYALVFPGQASQQIGMGADFRHSERGEALFQLADRAANLPISEVIASGPLERLTETQFAQPAVVATSLAALSALRTQLEAVGAPLPSFVAGHSVGELSALAAANVFDDEQVLRLVALRSRLMALACAAVDGTMAAVLGLGATDLEQLCEEASRATGQIAQLANLNAPDQLVVSGHRAAIAWIQSEGKQRGARRVVPLTVGGPFHSTYMSPAAEGFAAELAGVAPCRAAIPVVLNQTAQSTTDPDLIRQELATQIASPVRWAESLRTMAEAGCGLFVEVGPGQVLSGLVRRTVPDARTCNVQDQVSLEAAVTTILAYQTNASA